MERFDPHFKNRLKRFLKIFFSGTIMGAADVVPGVSGGTMAFILGVYDELLNSLKTVLSPDTVKLVCRFKFKTMFKSLPWPFLLTLGAGIISAILLFSSAIQWMLENRLPMILAFFFGLILGSVATVFHKVEKWLWDRFLALILGAVVGFVVVGLPMLAAPPEGKWYLVICGAIAICAMILPGISGSFMLLLMGKYEYIINAVNEIKKQINLAENLLSLFLFCIGMAAGISVFVRLLSWLLKKYHDITVAVLIGFMLGSLRKVWPWKAGDLLKNDNVLPGADTSLFLCILLALAGCVLVLAVEYTARRLEVKNKENH